MSKFREFFWNVFYNENSQRVWTKSFLECIKRDVAFEMLDR